MTNPFSSGHRHGHCHHDHGHAHAHARVHHDARHNHHGHRHAAPGGHGRSFGIAIGLNALFVAIEFSFGVIANSTALMADAGHNLSDVLGLILAWGATRLALRAPGGRFTYGLRSTSILAALANAVFLLVASGGIAWEAVGRFSSPPAVATGTVMATAGLGLIVNGISAWLFVKGSGGDLNIRGAYLHMAADAAVSAGVLVAALAMSVTGWYWLDPVISLAIVAIIAFGTLGMLKESVHLALSAVPAHLDLAAVAAHLGGIPGVSAVHDLHIWGMSTTESALTAHLVMPEGHPGDDRLDAIAESLKTQFGITHSTLQIELGTTDHGACALQSDGKSMGVSSNHQPEDRPGPGH